MFELSAENKTELLKIARESITSELIPPENYNHKFSSENLSIKTGAFVTIHKENKLRGCIGRMTSDKPLATTIMEMAKQAAFHDPRFPSVNKAELPLISIEISVLSPFQKISYKDIQLGTHGLLLKYGYNSGVFLPQVPIEQGWSKEEYVKHLYQKAGIQFTPETKKKAELFGFTAIVFGE